MSEHTSKLLFTFFSHPHHFPVIHTLLFKIAQKNLYKREKTALIFLFQMPWYTSIKKSQRKKKIQGTAGQQGQICVNIRTVMSTHKH